MYTMCSVLILGRVHGELACRKYGQIVKELSMELLGTIREHSRGISVPSDVPHTLMLL
jgi:hypothetical protein